MTEHGFDADAWPPIQQQVFAADILVIGTPIWLGEKSSVCTQVIERLYGYCGPAQRRRASGSTTAASAACMVTGNEDGIKHVAMNDAVLARSTSAT